MIAIVLSACMASDPNVCKDFRVPIDGGWDAMACAANAPPYFAKWAEEHPGWNIVRWKCQPTSSDDI